MWEQLTGKFPPMQRGRVGAESPGQGRAHTGTWCSGTHSGCRSALHLQGAVAPKTLPALPEEFRVQAPRPRPYTAAWGGDLRPRGGGDAGHLLVS